MGCEQRWDVTKYIYKHCTFEVPQYPHVLLFSTPTPTHCGGI